MLIKTLTSVSSVYTGQQLKKQRTQNKKASCMNVPSETHDSDSTMLWFLLSVAKVEQVKFDVTSMHARPDLAAQHKMVDDGSGETEVSEMTFHCLSFVSVKQNSFHECVHLSGLEVRGQWARPCGEEVARPLLRWGLLPHSLQISSQQQTTLHSVHVASQCLFCLYLIIVI